MHGRLYEICENRPGRAAGGPRPGCRLGPRGTARCCPAVAAPRRRACAATRRNDVIGAGDAALFWKVSRHRAGPCSSSSSSPSWPSPSWSSPPSSSPQTRTPAENGSRRGWYRGKVGHRLDSGAPVRAGGLSGGWQALRALAALAALAGTVITCSFCFESSLSGREKQKPLRRSLPPSLPQFEARA